MKTRLWVVQFEKLTATFLSEQPHLFVCAQAFLVCWHMQNLGDVTRIDTKVSLSPVPLIAWSIKDDVTWGNGLATDTKNSRCPHSGTNSKLFLWRGYFNWWGHGMFFFFFSLQWQIFLAFIYTKIIFVPKTLINGLVFYISYNTLNFIYCKCRFRVYVINIRALNLDLWKRFCWAKLDCDLKKNFVLKRLLIL